MLKVVKLVAECATKWYNNSRVLVLSAHRHGGNLIPSPKTKQSTFYPHLVRYHDNGGKHKIYKVNVKVDDIDLKQAHNNNQRARDKISVALKKAIKAKFQVEILWINWEGIEWLTGKPDREVSAQRIRPNTESAARHTGPGWSPVADDHPDRSKRQRSGRKAAKARGNGHYSLFDSP